MQWQAKWIWAKEHSDTRNCYIYARREIDLPATCDAAISIACSSHYQLYVNGHFVGRGSALGSETLISYDTHEVKRYLRSGRNAIGVIGYNYGADNSLGPQRRGGFLLQMESVDSPEPLLISDSHWKVKPADDWDFRSRRIGSGVGFQEIYDSCQKPVGWNNVTFDDAYWDTPDVSQPRETFFASATSSLPEKTLFPESISSWGLVPKSAPDDLNPAERLSLQEYQPDPLAIKYPQNLLRSGESTIINPGSEAFIVLDFGKEVVGYPNIRLRDGGYTVLDIGYGDVLDADGCVRPLKNGLAYADRLIIHGGRQEWQTFGRRAFRYIQLVFRQMQGPVHLNSVSVASVGHPVKQPWRFECSDSRITDIYASSAYSLSLHMQNTYERHPLRDPGSYPSESRIKALSNYYCYVDFELAESDLRRFALLQQKDGSFGLPLRSGHSTGSHYETLSWVLMLHDFYLYCGDRGAVEDIYDNLSRIIDDHLQSSQNELGLLTNHSGLPIAKWNAMYYGALRDASKLAIAVERFDDAQKWNSRAVDLLHAFNKAFWSDELSSYTSGTASASASVFAVAFGLADVNRCSLVKDQIKNSAEKLMPGFSHYVLRAMSKLGLFKEAVDALACSPDASAVHFLPSEILGITAASPLSNAVVIRPNTAGLSWAKGGYDLPTTYLDVEWKRDKDHFQIDINAPGGFMAAIPVSDFKNPVIHEIDLTPETPQRKARKTYGWGDIVWRDGGERDPYLDWLETQEAEPPEHYSPKNRIERSGSFVWVREPVSTQVRYLVVEDMRISRG